MKNKIICLYSCLSSPVSQKKYCRYDNSWKHITMATTFIVNKEQNSFERLVLTIQYLLIKSFNNTSLRDLALRSTTSEYDFCIQIQNKRNQSKHLNQQILCSEWLIFWSTISELILRSFAMVIPLLSMCSMLIMFFFNNKAVHRAVFALIFFYLIAPKAKFREIFYLFIQILP